MRAASAIQTQLEMDNAHYAADRRLAFRMGVSIGDVVEHGDDLLGDGVNIAARLQGLAPAGGLAVSNWVYEQIAGKLDLSFRDIGRQALKNIPGAVQVYLSDLTTTPDAAPRYLAATRAVPRASAMTPTYVVVGGLALLLAVGGFLMQRGGRAPTDAVIVALPPAALPETPPPPVPAVSPYPNLPEPGPAGPPSSSGSPESDRPPATPVVLQPLPPLPTALPRVQPNDDATATPPAAAPASTRILIPLPPVSPQPTPVQPVAVPPQPKAEPTFTLASPPKSLPPPSAPVSTEPASPPQKAPPVATPSVSPKKSPTAAASPKKDADPRRRAQLCREIVERVQMGEALSADDRDYLRTQCS